MTTFVTCSVTSCPSNSYKTCRAKKLTVGATGDCQAFNQAVDRSITDNYVEVEACTCQKCDHWELDEATSRGKCGSSSPLHFAATPAGSADEITPVCMDFKTQIGQPGFVKPV
jgi:hypothetical protein